MRAQLPRMMSVDCASARNRLYNPRGEGWPSRTLTPSLVEHDTKVLPWASRPLGRGHLARAFQAAGSSLQEFVHFGCAPKPGPQRSSRRPHLRFSDHTARCLLVAEKPATILSPRVPSIQPKRGVDSARGGRRSNAINSAGGPQIQPQRGEITKPRLKAWV